MDIASAHNFSNISGLCSNCHYINNTYQINTYCASIRNSVRHFKNTRPTISVNCADIETRNAHFEDSCRRKPRTILQVDFVRDHGINHDRPHRRRLKGFATIFILTVSFCIIWTPTVISYLIPLHPLFANTMDTISGIYSLVQPIIYLLANSKAMRMCLVTFRQSASKCMLSKRTTVY